MKKIPEAIRADTAQALVEAKAGVSVPAPCQCKCVLLRAVALALLLSMFPGAAATVFSLIGCCCCCWKCCRGGCCGPKPEEAPATTPRSPTPRSSAPSSPPRRATKAEPAHLKPTPHGPLVPCPD